MPPKPAKQADDLRDLHDFDPTTLVCTGCGVVKTTVAQAAERCPGEAGMGDGTATAVSPPEVLAAVRRRRPDGTFIDGPGIEVSRAAQARGLTVRKHRHMIAQAIIGCCTPAEVVMHFKRLSKIIEKGVPRDAIAAFRAIYDIAAVKPGQEFRTGENEKVPAPGSPAAPPPGERPLHAPVIILPTPPAR